MDFMEEIELYNLAMDNAYALIVGDMKLDEMIIELDDEDEDDILPLPFNPFSGEKISNSMIDVVINHYTGLEEYEKCARLVKAKEGNA
jgi:hypothetical protein